MAIPYSTLRNAAGRVAKARARDLAEARTLGQKTAFLCHSHDDEQLVKGLLVLLSEAGWDAYVDWADTKMPAEPNRDTAARIRKKIEGSRYFLFLATEKSTRSRWCPWEIGIADGKKPIDSIVVITTLDDSNRWHGSEYLQLYRSLDMNSPGSMEVRTPGQLHGLRLATAL